MAFPGLHDTAQSGGQTLCWVGKDLLAGLDASNREISVTKEVAVTRRLQSQSPLPTIQGRGM